MIKKVLVANRGEIAIRVMRSCREMGIQSVAVFSDADRTSMHERYADKAYHIGASPSSESYLNIEKIIDVARRSGADAIHPGYGFLSENAAFADRCAAEGSIFIGPDGHSISSMGDKIMARKRMIEAGVPVVPGTTEPITDEKEAIEVIHKIGLPVMIKAMMPFTSKNTSNRHITSSVRYMPTNTETSFIFSRENARCNAGTRK